MTLQTKTALVLIAIVCATAVSSSYSQDKFRLKPGAKGKVCLNCHETFKEKMQLPFLHTPVRKGDCSDCHNPHTSSHGKLLSGDVKKICLSCHEGIVPGKAQSTHRVAVEGNCVKCHDPHAAKNKNNLLLAGNELCFGCHQRIAKEVAGNKFKHSPAEKGCVNCHNPHGSSKAASLLKEDMPTLCVACHKPDTPAFGKQHMGYPVARSRCTSCHDPHGSSTRGMFWAKGHQPVMNRMCSQCHPEPASPDALKGKKPGFELCRGCHNNMMNDTFGRNRMHGPVVDKVSCLNCHRPHASRENALLKGPQLVLCGQCHQDTVEKQKKSLVKHPPVEEGNCTACHRPHSSNNAFLMDNASMFDICGTCHEWQRHSTHPIGEKVIDKRNRNLGMDCTSCHSSHGSEHKRFAHYDLKMDLCVQCHEKFQR
jgi:predicted CXXCH cytochrome family protein